MLHIKNMKIWMQLLATIGVALLVVWSGVIVWQNHAYRATAIEQAQRSAAAAKEIKALIGDSVEKVDAGTKLVHHAGATMNEIVDSIRHVTDIMGEITAASNEQTGGIEKVNDAIVAMDAVTQQNASLVEKAAIAAQSLQDQASKLEQVVGVFKLEGGTPPVALALQPVSENQGGTVVPLQRRHRLHG